MFNKNLCENKLYVKDIPDKELIYYTENDKKYCLIIKDIALRFKENNFLNPYTSVPFSEDFIFTFNNVYLPEQNRLLENVNKKNIIIEDIIEKPEIEAPGFLDFILNDINMMEQIQKESNLQYELQTQIIQPVLEQKEELYNNENIIIPEVLKYEFEISKKSFLQVFLFIFLYVDVEMSA